MKLQHSLITRGAVPPLLHTSSRRGATGTYEIITQSTLHAISHPGHAQDNAGTSSTEPPRVLPAHVTAGARTVHKFIHRTTGPAVALCHEHRLCPVDGLH